jgi:hypothetical protein
MLQAVYESSAALLAKAGNVSKLGLIKGHPIEQAGDLPGIDQLVPGAWSDPGKGKTFVAAEPFQPGAELAFATGAQLPAAQGVKVWGMGHLQFNALDTP